MFDSVDIDHSGFIDYSEFVIASMNEKQLLTNEKLQAAFKMFDKVSQFVRYLRIKQDGSGTISSDEIKEVLGFGKSLSEEAVQEIINQVDENGDGQISFEEFASMMKRLSA